MQHTVTRGQMQPTDLPVVAPSDRRGELAVGDVKRQVDLIQAVMKEVMVEGHHFGVIPGTGRGDEQPKPVLFKPGAEKLCMTFRLAAHFDFLERELPNDHRDVRATCTLTHIPTGAVVASASGSCSSRESKYRYRNAKAVCPSCGVDAINKGDEEYYCWKKKGGCGRKFPLEHAEIRGQKLGKAENPDIADQWNTVLKMAAKRAHTAATLLALAASDMFIVEEDADDEEDERGEDEPRRGQQRRATGGAAQQQQRAQGGAATPREERLKACAVLATELGFTREQLTDVLKDYRIDLPDRWVWANLDDPTLERAHDVLATLKKQREGQK